MWFLSLICVYVAAQKTNRCPQCNGDITSIRDGEGLLKLVSPKKFDNFSPMRPSGDERDPCRICGEDDGEETLIMCDGRSGRCNEAYHLCAKARIPSRLPPCQHKRMPYCDHARCLTRSAGVASASSQFPMEIGLVPAAVGRLESAMSLQLARRTLASTAVRGELARRHCR